MFELAAIAAPTIHALAPTAEPTWRRNPQPESNTFANDAQPSPSRTPKYSSACAGDCNLIVPIRRSRGAATAIRSTVAPRYPSRFPPTARTPAESRCGRAASTGFRHRSCAWNRGTVRERGCRLRHPQLRMVRSRTTVNGASRMPKRMMPAAFCVTTRARDVDSSVPGELSIVIYVRNRKLCDRCMKHSRRIANWRTRR